ncbi:MAG: ribosome silencing factor, partial [Planctomycetota bacterium]
REDALALGRKAQDLKGVNPQVLDVSAATVLFHAMVIVSASSRRHAKALAEGLLVEAKTRNMYKLGVEGMDEASWILLDLTDVIVHIFLPEMREYYNLEFLWADAETVPLPPPGDT